MSVNIQRKFRAFWNREIKLTTLKVQQQTSQRAARKLLVDDEDGTLHSLSIVHSITQYFFNLSYELEKECENFSYTRERYKNLCQF